QLFLQNVDGLSSLTRAVDSPEPDGWTPLSVFQNALAYVLPCEATAHCGSKANGCGEKMELVSIGFQCQTESFPKSPFVRGGEIHPSREQQSHEGFRPWTYVLPEHPEYRSP